MSSELMRYQVFWVVRACLKSMEASGRGAFFRQLDGAGRELTFISSIDVQPSSCFPGLRLRLKITPSDHQLRI